MLFRFSFRLQIFQYIYLFFQAGFQSPKDSIRFYRILCRASRINVKLKNPFIMPIDVEAKLFDTNDDQNSPASILVYYIQFRGKKSTIKEFIDQGKTAGVDIIEPVYHYYYLVFFSHMRLQNASMGDRSGFIPADFNSQK